MHAEEARGEHQVSSSVLRLIQLDQLATEPQDLYHWDYRHILPHPFFMWVPGISIRALVNLPSTLPTGGGGVVKYL